MLRTYSIRNGKTNHFVDIIIAIAAVFHTKYLDNLWNTQNGEKLKFNSDSNENEFSF